MRGFLAAAATLTAIALPSAIDFPADDTAFPGQEAPRLTSTAAQRDAV